MDRRTVGILGGGQLGRMMIEAANKLGIRTAVLDPGGPSSSAGQLSNLCIEGSFRDVHKIRELASISDVITTEIEHVNVTVLSELQAEGRIVHPSAEDLSIIQDKLIQKEFMLSKNVPVGEFMAITDVHSAQQCGLQFGYPFILKNRRLAYDGRGNTVVINADEIPSQIGKLGNGDLFAEKLVDFAKELAVTVVRSKEGMSAYPAVETIHENSVCNVVIAPAQISSIVAKTAEEVAIRAVSGFTGYGVYAVELFLMHDDSVLVNEIAPRPHNSGHYTIEGCEIDQFEMHLRAILGLPCPTPRMKVPCALMLNVLGWESMDSTREVLQRSLSVPGATPHWYSKLENRPGRKMAHITITADSIPILRERASLLGISETVHSLPIAGPRVSVIMGSDSDLPTMRDAANVLESFDVPFEVTIVSAHRTPSRMYAYAQSAAERGIQVIIAGAGGAAHLPGMVASLTSLPVIGIPIHTKALGGQDSLYSIVQMPKGVPVATVGIDNATNAGLLAVRILAAQDRGLQTRMDAYLLKQEEEQLRKSSKLEASGYKDYA